MKATLKFQQRFQAEKFAKLWGRYSKKGHSIGSGMTDVEVDIYNVTEKDKEWINKYIYNLTKRNNENHCN